MLFKRSFLFLCSPFLHLSINGTGLEWPARFLLVLTSMIRERQTWMLSMVPNKRENSVENLRCLSCDSSRNRYLGEDTQNALRCQCLFSEHLLCVTHYANHWEEQVKGHRGVKDYQVGYAWDSVRACCLMLFTRVGITILYSVTMDWVFERIEM